MNLKAQRKHAIEAAQAVIAKARAERRDLTSSERSELEAKHAEVQSLTDQIDRQDSDAELLAKMDALSGSGSSGGIGEFGTDTGVLSFKGVTEKVLRTPEGSKRGIKSLIAGGSQAVETVGQPLVAQWERPVGNLLDVLPAKEVPENFSYLRQTVRTNNAAPVAVGGLKPTSIFTLARVESRLRVVAHMSEPIPEFWLKDEGALKQFVESEMVGGLRDAVIQQALVGDGTGENLLGIRLQSGIQTQAFTTDMFESIRRGIGAAEDLGYTPGVIVMAPSDWTTIELTKRVAGGGYLLADSNGGSPVDRAKKQIWGVPVVTNVSHPTGFATLLSQDTVGIFHDGVVELKWGVINDDFGKNQVRARCEGRFQVGATRPMGVVNIDIAA